MLSFNGQGGYVNLAKSDVSGSWTAAMWVNRENAPSTSSVLMSSNNYSIKLEQWNNVKKVGITKYGVGDYSFNYTAPISAWTHLTFVGTSTGTSLYVNGVLQDTLGVVIDCPMDKIGVDKGATDGYLKAILDDLMVYNMSLSSQEVLNLYNSVSPAPTANIPSNVNLALNQTYLSSGNHSSPYVASKAFDGNTTTRWATSDGTSACWLEVDFNSPVTFNKTVIKEFINRVTGYTIQYWNGTAWIDVASGSAIGAVKSDTFNSITSNKVRLNITNASVAPSIWEFEVYNAPKPQLSLASRVLIDKGIQIHSWIPTDTTGRAYPTASEFNGINMTGVTYYEEPLYNSTFHAANPNAQWNLAKAPYCTNAVGQNPPNNSDFLTAQQRANIDNLVSICFGDEQNFSATERGYLKNWFDLSHTLYPNVLVHVNGWLGQMSTATLNEFTTTAKPDILTFDNYYFDQVQTYKDYQIPARMMDAINTVRPTALAGHDGTGNAPIAFGQYLLGYKSGTNQAGTGWYEITESQKYLITNLTFAMGGKWLDMFRWEYDPSVFLLFDANRNPTRHYYEYAESFRQSRNLGEHLVRLNSTDVRVALGKHMSSSTPVNNSLPGSVQSFTANTEYHLSNISAVNLGTQNNGLAGDVVVGYLKPLPGINTNEFFTSTNPKYFMVVNGLTQGNGLQVAQQHGACNETQQAITLTFDMSNGDISKLRKVDRNTGNAVSVPLTQVSGNTYKVDITLGGGQTDLFFWEE